jgi:hypothetical protein
MSSPDSAIRSRPIAASDEAVHARASARPDWWRWPVVFAIVAAVVAVTGLPIFLPVAAWALTAMALPIRVPLSSRLVLAIPLVIAWLVVITAPLQLVGLGLRSLPTWGPLIVVAAAIRGRRGRLGDIGRPRFESAWDLSPIIVAVACVTFLVSGAFLALPDGTDPGFDRRLSMLASGEDGASHLSIVQAVRAGSGFAYVEAGRAASPQWPYPPGFHLGAASLATVVEDTRGSNEVRGNEADAFWLSMVLAFGALVVAAGTLAMRMSRSFQAPAPIAGLIGGIVAVSMVVWTPVALLVLGFAPQMLATAMLLAALIAISEAPALGSRCSLVIVATAFVAIGWTWFFLLPVLGACVLAWLWIDRQIMLQHVLFVVGLSCVSLAAVVPPIHFSIRDADPSVVNSVGGVTEISNGIAFGLSVAAVAGLLMLGPRDIDRRIRMLGGAFVLSASGFAWALGEYQRQTVGATEYFYGKSLFTVAIVALAVSFASTGGLVVRVGVPTIRGGLAILMIALAAAMVIEVRPHDPERSLAQAYRSGDMQGPALRSSLQRYVNAHGDIDGRAVIQWGQSTQPVEDYVASRWLTTLNGKADGDAWRLWHASAHEQDPKELARFVNETGGNVAVLTSTPDLVDKLRAAGADEDSLRSVVVVP